MGYRIERGKGDGKSIFFYRIVTTVFIHSLNFRAATENEK